MNVLQLEEALPHEYEMNMIYECFGIGFMDSAAEAAADHCAVGQLSHGPWTEIKPPTHPGKA